MHTSGGYRNYLLALLTAIMVFNYVDRVALGLLLQDIKQDFDLTDTQLGLLTGIAFSLFYAAMGIPIARWADRGNRVTIISLSAAIWSCAVALCAAAASFAQLLTIRVVVAVGEAGCQPPAFSLIADYFSRGERPRAIAIYTSGWCLAVIVGFFAAGWINEVYGWRVTLFVLAAPGLLLALLARLTIKEPRRLAPPPTGARQAPGVGNILRGLWANRTLRFLTVAASLSYFFGNGILQWQPSFFVRSHGLDSGELGTWFAGIYGVGGLIGVYLGGELASRFAAANERIQLQASAVAYVLLALLSAAVYLVKDTFTAFAILTAVAIIAGTVNGPLFALTQTLVPSHMRAMSVAILLFFCNLIGLGLGPLAAGALSDRLSAIYADDSLRYSLLALCPGYIACAWLLWRGASTAGADVEHAFASDQAQHAHVRAAARASV